jgi:hypothetical protein
VIIDFVLSFFLDFRHALLDLMILLMLKVLCWMSPPIQHLASHLIAAAENNSKIDIVSDDSGKPSNTAA